MELVRRWIAEGTLLRRAWTGAWCVVQGMLLTLRSPSLLRLAVVPVIINVLLYVAFGYGAWQLLGPAHAWLFPGPAPDAWYAFLWTASRAAAWLILAAVLFLTALMLVALVGSILAAPVLDAISARAEKILTGREPPAGPGVVDAVMRALRGQLTLLLMYAVSLAFGALAYLVPVVGSLLGPLVQASVTLSFLCVQFLEWPAERRLMGPRERMALVRRHKAVSAGFGLAAWLMMILPFTMPFLATGGTLLFLSLNPHSSVVTGGARST
ncbi:MAG: EI24 domain-containing protein [Myxococcota bacterium]